jgi:hypothetical protein
MSHTHPDHDHCHGPGCGHVGVHHEGHVDFLHDGHLHHQREDGSVEDHVIPVSEANPGGCTADHPGEGHDSAHAHGPGCGHPAVPHGDHVDYLVDGRLHHQHGDHCDDHGPLDISE